jgi:acetyl-CoA synthetase
MEPFVWRPSAERLEGANLTRLMGRLGARDYHELHRISVEEPARFWPELIDDLGIEFSRPWHTVVDTSRGPEWATWFDGGHVNVARVCLHRWAAARPEDEALVGRYEDGTRESLSYAEASRQVVQLAEALVELGVGEGDRVALYLPMAPAAAVAAHACAHIGAVHVPIFSGFAAPAIASRLEDSQARVAICADWSLRRGKRVDIRATLDEAGPHALEHVVEWSRDTRAWPEIVTRQPGELRPREVDSEAPYLLAYTSGTTGRPKGAKLVTAGFLVSIAREAAYQTDVKEGDRVHFATDMGWIMGPWTVVGAGAVGATIVFAEGAPDWPHDRLWQLIESERVTMLGLSPTLVRALIPHGDPVADLSSLRAICTTGEPWNPEPYRWLYANVGRSRVPIINFSGGTEVAACFLSPVPSEPIKATSLGGPVLGMAMDIVDDDGRSLVGTGEVGELVCRKPFPGMTRGFWHDPERYLDTYWRRIPGVWVHGDWASCDADGFWFLHGRSDDTLNIAGKRIGPAEVESAAVEHPAVREAAAVGVPHEVKGETAWVFCCLLPGFDPSTELEAEIAAVIAGKLGKAFAPGRVVIVEALPKTRSAKIVRRAVKAAALGGDPGDLSSVENPEALDAIAARLA